MYDSQRFLLEWFDAICDSPSLLYHLALRFSPSSSWLYESYATELSQKVKVVKGLPGGWETCSRTVTFNDERDSRPWAITCWKDTIAVGLAYGDIVTLDAITGIQTAILSGHTWLVQTLAFFPDGKFLVSGSNDKTVKLWDVQTGGVVKTFYGHTESVSSVSISANCTMIASGSFDHTIRLWHIWTEECHHIIEQESYVYNVGFSPTDPLHLVSVSGRRIWHWDINGQQTRPTYDGLNIAFSPDGTRLFLHQYRDIVVQNTSSGETVAKFYGASTEAEPICLSPDGRLVAAADGRTAHVWDTTSSHPYPIKTFLGHNENINFLAFSSPSSLISSSQEKSAKFWQIGAMQTDPVVTDPKPTLLTSAPIKLVTLQVEDGFVISSDLKGVVRTWDISTGLCKASFQIPAKDLVCSDVQLVNSRLIYVGHAEMFSCTTFQTSIFLHMWDVEEGKHFQTVWFGPSANIIGVKILGDGSRVICLHWEKVQAWSIQTGKLVVEVELTSPTSQRSLSVSGSRVWVHSPKLETLGWDFGVLGSTPIQLSNAPLSQSNHTIIWDIKQSRMRDTTTGKVVFQLAGRFAKPTDSQWDGRYLVVGYESGEVLILDFNHMFL